MADPITPGEQRIELQIEGLRSVVAGGFVALGASLVRIEALLERIAIGLEGGAVRPARTTNQGLTPIR